MTFTAAEQDKIDPLVHAFRDYSMGRANIIITRFHFNTHDQATESMKAFITALKDKIKDCDYGTLEDSLFPDRLVAGVHNTALRNKLLQSADLTLTKCVDICELSEFNSKQLETAHDRSTTQEVDYIIHTSCEQQALARSQRTHERFPATDREEWIQPDDNRQQLQQTMPKLHI